jgi:hypothetical protein
MSALILLALCVFLWGFEYKLSLYDPPHSFARLVPIAKLLSKNEQPRIATSSSAAASAGPKAARLHAAPIDSLLSPAALPALSLTAVRTGGQQFNFTWVPLISPHRTCFVRPPPIQT